MILFFLASFYDAARHLIKTAKSLIRPLPVSKMFLLKRELEEYRKRNPDSPVYDASQGDGGASLGGIPTEELIEAFRAFHKSTAYGQPNGDERLRWVIHNLYYHFDYSLARSETSPEHVIVCDGGRDALQKWYQAIHLLTGKIGGMIITSAAPWISYAHGTYVNGFNLLCAPAPGKMDFRITPNGIDAAMELARKSRKTVRALIVTSPDNPTGTYYTPQELITLIRHAYAAGIRYILIDAIYQMVIDEKVKPYDWHEILFENLTKEERQTVTILDGITKSVGASNIRNAHLWAGDKAFADVLKAIASHTVLPNPMGEAVAYELYRQEYPSEHPWVKRITGPTSESRRIFRELMTAHGHNFVADQGYYAFVDIEPWLQKKVPSGMEFKDNDTEKLVSVLKTAEHVGSYLSTQHGLAVVPGTPFRQPTFIRFSLAQNPKLIPHAVRRFHHAFTLLS